MLKRIKNILNSSENAKLLSIILGSSILALSETVSIGLIIPIMKLFVSDGNFSPASIVGRFQAAVGLHDKTAFLTALILLTMAIFLFKSIFSVIMLRSQYNFAGDVYCRLTERALASYLYKPYSLHLEKNSSVLFKNIITEVGQFTSGFLSPLIFIASEAMVFIAILALLVCIYPLMTFAFAAIFIVITLCLDMILKRKIKDCSIEREEHSKSIYVTANEALSGIKEIQVNGVQSYFIKRFSQATTKYQSGFIKFNVLSNLPRYILEVTAFFSMLVILLINLYLRKSPSELIPMMTVMAAASIKLLPSINKIYLNFNTLHYYTNSLDIVYEILKDADAVPDRQSEAVTKIDDNRPGAPAVSAKGVSFKYKEDGASILDNINLDIPFSAVTAIVGASGAGKSTLIDLFTGLLTPTKGKICYGGVAVDRNNVAGLRGNIGYVPQQIFLIDDSIGANIAFGIGSERVDLKKLDNAVKMANLDSFIKSLSKGLDTPAGEKGVRLSGGQRQRIGIARSLYRSPGILILDEATSALDGNSEAEVIGAIKKMRDAGMAVLIVAHRLSTISNADHIYVMEHGRILAEGSFTELSANSGIFNKIVHAADKA